MKSRELFFYSSWDIKNFSVSRKIRFGELLGVRYEFWFDNIITDSQTIGDDAHWDWCCCLLVISFSRTSSILCWQFFDGISGEFLSCPLKFKTQLVIEGFLHNIICLPTRWKVEIFEMISFSVESSIIFKTKMNLLATSRIFLALIFKVIITHFESRLLLAMKSFWFFFLPFLEITQLDVSWDELTNWCLNYRPSLPETEITSIGKLRKKELRAAVVTRKPIEKSS